MSEEKSNIFSLPDEVLARILRVLTVKNLTQLRVVCKFWRDYIASKDFIRGNIDFWRSSRSTSFMSYARHRFSEEEVYMSLGFNGEDIEASRYNMHCCGRTVQKNHAVQYTVLVSCDGLLLVEITQVCNSAARLHVCNPITRSCRLLPEKRGALTIDNPRKRCTWAMVYDTSVGVYKVLGMEGTGKCHVFELHEGKRAQTAPWRVLHLRRSLPAGYWTVRKCASRDGVVHFLMQESGEGFLVSLDVSKEELKVSSLFAMPRSLSVSDRLSESNGAFYYVDPSTDCDFELWILNDFDNPRWIMHQHIVKDKHKHLMFTWPSWHFGPKVLVVGQDETRLIMQYWEGKEIFTYDLISGEWRTLKLDRVLFGRPGEVKRTCGLLEAQMFLHHVPSLLSCK